MNAPFRVAGSSHPGRIDRNSELSFTMNGDSLTGHRGDTLASAMLAHGIRQVCTSIKYGRPRGIGAAGPEDPSSLVQVQTPFEDPMQLATMVDLFDGLHAYGLPGQGRLADTADPARYDAMHLHAELLIVGAGPAGLTAALTAARTGTRVVLVDERSEAGGSLLGTHETLNDADALDWVADAVAELNAADNVTVLHRTTAFGHYDDGFVLALQRRTDHLGFDAPAHQSRQRIWRIRAKQVLVATGAHERPIVFDNNDRPNIMLAGAARTFLHRYGVLAGRRPVVFTTNDSAYETAADLAAAGAELTVVDARARVPEHLRADCERLGIRLHVGSVVTDTAASETGAVDAVHVVPADEADRSAAAPTVIGCDLLLLSGGWNPAVHLFSQIRGKLKYDEGLGAFVPAEDLATTTVAGSAAGHFTLGAVLADGVTAATTALDRLDVTAEAPPLPAAAAGHEPGEPLVLWRVRSRDAERDGQFQFVDVQRDATVADIAQAIGTGMRSVEHVKRYTTIGTAHDQGKTSGVVTSGIVAELLGEPVAAAGTTTFRPPYTPVPFAALAGRDRGALYDPERTTAAHDWHVMAGAEFENVGQWKRPWYYPLEGESMDEAVRRETIAARTSVGILDGSTLGKIDVRGPDAPVLLDRMYTNMMSSLKVGKVRYGLMCGLDGMVKDDGTVMRIAEDHYVLFPTTGGAAAILDWLEEFVQTEWPELDVYLTSVTEQWVTYPVVGPASRAVLASVIDGIDFDNDGFEFMGWRDGSIDGVPVRVARISFSGELAYEVNVEGSYGLALWERLFAAGEPYGITPYGTETMHVLRAEKGYPIIGQDTDGTVTPQDLNMGWAVSKKKKDFIGKRSFDRVANHSPTRRQFVGILPEDPEFFLPEGTQLIDESVLVAENDDGALPPAPVPMLGFITSAYRSAAIGSCFGLALVEAGHSRTGEKIRAVVDGVPVPVTITSHVLFDSEGARRDG